MNDLLFKKKKRWVGRRRRKGEGEICGSYPGSSSGEETYMLSVKGRSWIPLEITLVLFPILHKNINLIKRIPLLVN